MIRSGPLPFKRKKSRTKSTKKFKQESTAADGCEDPKKVQGSFKNHESLKISDDDDVDDAQLLDSKTIMEGMKILGCVREVRKDSLVMSLPGFLSGFVLLKNISNRFTELLCNDSEDFHEPDINSIIKLGMVFPCKVIKVSPRDFPKKPLISLSINPQDVNENLKPRSLRQDMVLFATVSSIEDHGYVMDVGIKNVNAFLPYCDYIIHSKVEVGQVIPTRVEKKKYSVLAASATVELSQLSFDAEFSVMDEESISLTSILPGTSVNAYVTEVRYPFVYMKCLNFKSCAYLLSMGNSYKNITEGNKVSGTVLYVHPVTNMIYLHLGPKPTPETFTTFFGFKKYELVYNIKIQHFSGNKAFCKLPRGAVGFVNKSIIKGDFSKKKVTAFPRACVVFFHYMDNLVQLSLKKSLLNKEIKSIDDFGIGDICKGYVKNHVEGGMIVSICPGVRGFVRTIYMSDVLLTKPDKFYPVDTEVSCRVVQMLSNGLLHLTCKQSLLLLSEQELLKSYEDAVPGQIYKGVVVEITQKYFLVVFFNGVKGIVSGEYMPSVAQFFVGQTVDCEILNCYPSKKKLILSLKSEERVKSRKYVLPVTFSSPSVQRKTKFAEEVDEKDTGESDKKEWHPEYASKIESNDYTKEDSFESKITKITGHQLNIMIGSEIKGRVHITEIGCSEENKYPLREFSLGQIIKIHIIGDFFQRSIHFLDVSHRRMLKFKECALKFPEPVPLNPDFTPGMKVIGFIKEVCDACAVLWLSPDLVGTLDYLHFSSNPKELQKLQKKLEVGFAIKATVLNVKESSKDGLRSTVSLTRLEDKLPFIGNNIVGLVRCADPVNGLILKLPHGYHGKVDLTDLQDIYIPLHPVLAKYLKLKFILCYVLDVNHMTKYCSLSLRRSRLYKKKKEVESGKFCPELNIDDLKQGNIVKGYVTLVCGSYIFVKFGRTLEGKALLHSCQSDCSDCKNSKKIRLKYPVGSVAEVVLGDSIGDNMYHLSFIEQQSPIVDTQPNRLSIKEDISWDEL